MGRGVSPEKNWKETAEIFAMRELTPKNGVWVRAMKAKSDKL
jgi:hypothetical protein